MFDIWQNKGCDIYLCCHKFPWVYLCSVSYNMANKQNLTSCESVFLLTVYCLAYHGNIVLRSPAEITAWHPWLHARIQSLDPYTKKRPLEMVPRTELPIIEFDSD